MFFRKTVKNINRLREVVKVLLKYGMEDIVVNTPLRKFIPPKTTVNWTSDQNGDTEMVAVYSTRWERIRMIIEELGPTFIKLAQVLSNRPDFVPEALIFEFEKLQSSVPPFDVGIAKGIITQELGRPLDELFIYFDEVPLGSASIGQVHRARLRSGEDVVVKVQRPGVRSKVYTDLALLREFVKLTENFFINAGVLNPLEVVNTFEKSMQRELDYLTEGRHMEQFRQIYQNLEERFYVPKAYMDISTSKVLVIEYISGCKITDLMQIESWGLDRTTLAARGIDLYLTQIFEFGIFHADPHPGNVLIRPTGQIVLLDFGMVGKLMKHQKYAFANVFISLAKQDARGMASGLRQLSIDSEIEDMRAFEYDLHELIEEYTILDVAGELGMADLTNKLQKIIYKYQLQMPGAVFLILRVLVILEGIGNVLDKNFQSLEHIKPYGFKLLTEQYSLKNINSEITYSLSEFGGLLYNLPSEVRFILKKLRKGEFNFDIKFIADDTILKKADSITNRIALAMLVCTLILSATLSLSAKFPAYLCTDGGIPYLSIIGYLLAIWLTGVLFVLSVRNNS
ncbi:ABC1 kinase family protein [Hugenholtzia roseola]|uniref:ABC1 kinase family protein n=1 Tax=Hugenholtzia roseola TaxID=1002 RepID=UPI0004229EA5|nr:AarF/UbiB family protein [Hugenholtzia roseola]